MIKNRPKQANPPSGRNPTQPGKIKTDARKGPSLDVIILFGDHLSVGTNSFLSFPGTALFFSPETTSTFNKMVAGR